MLWSIVQTPFAQPQTPHQQSWRQGWYLPCMPWPWRKYSCLGGGSALNVTDEAHLRIGRRRRLLVVVGVSVCVSVSSVPYCSTRTRHGCGVHRWDTPRGTLSTTTPSERPCTQLTIGSSGQHGGATMSACSLAAVGRVRKHDSLMAELASGRWWHHGYRADTRTAGMAR